MIATIHVDWFGMIYWIVITSFISGVCYMTGYNRGTEIEKYNQEWRRMKFYIYFNLLGLPWPFDIEINRREENLVRKAIAETSSKIQAIKLLRHLWPEDEHLGLKEAKEMIDAEWQKGAHYREE